MKVIIDRFEENIAVVELDGEMLHAPRALFADAQEGDTVELRVLPRRKKADPQPDDAAGTPADADIESYSGEDRPADAEPQNAEDRPADSADEDVADLFAKLRKKRKKHRE